MEGNSKTVSTGIYLRTSAFNVLSNGLLPLMNRSEICTARMMQQFSYVIWDWMSLIALKDFSTTVSLTGCCFCGKCLLRCLCFKWICNNWRQHCKNITEIHKKCLGITSFTVHLHYFILCFKNWPSCLFRFALYPDCSYSRSILNIRSILYRKMNVDKCHLMVFGEKNDEVQKMLERL